MAPLDRSIQNCTAMLSSIEHCLNCLSDVHVLPLNARELEQLNASVNACLTVLSGAQALLAVESKRWGM